MKVLRSFPNGTVPDPSALKANKLIGAVDRENCKASYTIKKIVYALISQLKESEDVFYCIFHESEESESLQYLVMLFQM